MLKIHMTDGETLSYDLESDTQGLISLLKKSNFQSKITAISVCNNGVQHSLVRPQGYRRVSFLPEHVRSNGRVKGGIRITCFAGDSKITLMAHSQGSIRVSASRVGHQLYDPTLDSIGNER